MAIRATIDVVWTVVVETSPAVARHCRACGDTSDFVSSEKFRINARGRRVDVWLIYRCARCSSTWNRALWTRARPATIGASRFQALQRNDPSLARQVARDLEQLAEAGGQPVPGVGFRVRGDPVDPGADTRWRVRFVLSEPCKIRLDKVLARGLGVSRGAVLAWIRSRRLWMPMFVGAEVGGNREVAQSDTSVWRRPVRDEHVVILEAPD